MGAPAAAVRLESLTRRFPRDSATEDGLDRVAVDALSFTIARGELFGLVGPDGAGKTTVLRMLAGVLPASAGRAWIDGIEVTSDPEAAKPRLAYMPQRFGLYEDLTVQENLDFYASLFGVPSADLGPRLQRLYRFSGLGEFTGRLAGALSGGMKQKLSLSCALVHQPSVLLLDEPTFGVDPISRRDLWLILHEMIAEGITIVVSTSYLDEAERCDRVALLDDGHLLALDAPAALQGELAGRMLEVVASDPRAARDLLRADPAVESAVLFGDALHVIPRTDEAWTGARSRLEAEGIGVDGIRPLEPSLEDVFIRYVQERS